MNQAQAVLTRISNGWVTKVKASVYHEAGSYFLLVECEAQHPASNHYMQQNWLGRYTSFNQALTIMDTGIFTLITERGFTQDIYNVEDDSIKTTTAQQSSRPDGVYDQDGWVNH